MVFSSITDSDFGHDSVKYILVGEEDRIKEIEITTQSSDDIDSLIAFDE